MEPQKILKIFDSLPDNAKQEVIDFLEFLQKRYGKQPKNKKTVKKSLAEEAFVGMWKDRKDITDSTRWVKSLRKQEWDN